VQGHAKYRVDVERRPPGTPAANVSWWVTREVFMDTACCYVSKNNIGNGEFLVEGRTKSGQLVFGFRTFMDGFSSWKDKARRYAAPNYIAVFDLPKRELESIAPPCEGAACRYRMKYVSLPLQRNALRVEIMTPADRCGWMLKEGRIGGHPDDYHPCERPQRYAK